MFNAIAYTRSLESVGFTREQAEATLNMLYDFTNQNLATKQDMADVRAEISEFKHEVAQDFANVRHSLELLEKRMTIKLGSLIVIAIGVVATLQKIL